MRDSEDPRLQNSTADANNTNTFNANNTNTFNANNFGSAENVNSGNEKSHKDENGVSGSPPGNKTLHLNNNANGADTTLEDKDKTNVGPRVLLSGFVPSELSEVRKMCDELNVQVTSQAKLATHLVMPNLGRTISFLCAISYVKFVLNVDWIKESHKDKKLQGNCDSQLKHFAGMVFTESVMEDYAGAAVTFHWGLG